jgi:Tol biopolymer transport system component
LDLVLLDTDGGARRTVATTKGHVGLAWPGWFADNRRVTAVETSAEGRGRIIGYDTATSARSAIVDTVAFPESIEPSYPRSATRVYFYGTSAAGQHGLYRQNLDGSGVELVLADFIDVVSPDEQSVLRLGQNQILNHNLSTGQETVVATSNYTPFWSPAGDLIAYTVLNGSNTLDLHVVRPDGSNDRLLSAGIYDARSFSPDGQWIATIHYGSGIELVRVSDGLRLPVGGGQSFSQVAWRRE